MCLDLGNIQSPDWSEKVEIHISIRYIINIVLKKKIFIVIGIFLFTILFFFVCNEYLLDLQGISIRGVYECEGKRLKEIALDKYYAPSEIWKKAQSLGYKGTLHTGFGEPDNQGNGLYVDVQMKDRSYRLLFGRVRDSDWKKVVVWSHEIGNSCLVPFSVLKKEIINILDALGIDTDKLELKFVRYYNLPWITLYL